MKNKTEMKVVLIRNTEYDYTTVCEVRDYEVPGHVILTEPLSVTFVHLDQSAVQEAMIQTVLEEIKEDERKYEEKVKQNNEKLNELRALTAPTEG